MSHIKLPEDSAKQWEVLLLLIASEEMKKIDRTKNEVDTMTYLLNNEGVTRILLQWLRQMRSSYGRKMSDQDTAVKCDSISLYWRLQGNEKFKKKLMEESYKCFSKSLLYATPKGLEYAMALTNRSAALYKLKRYKECLADVDLALSIEFPLDVHSKLLVRQTNCYIAIREKEKAEGTFNQAVEILERFKIIAAQNENKVGNLLLDKNYLDDLDKQVSLLRYQLESVEDKLDETIQLPPVLKGDNTQFVSASSLLELRRDETLGRMVITNEKIKRGDVLFSEEPYAWVPLPSQLAVCDGCSDININVVPCTTCSRTVYCSKECLEKAVIYHQYECVGAQSDLFKTIGIAHLALRVLLNSVNNGLPILRTETRELKASDLFEDYSSVDNIEIYKADTPDFLRMFNLVTNFDKMSNMDYTQYALTAVMLTLYLEHFTSFLEYFQSKMPDSIGATQLRIFTGAMLLRALGQLVCNGHAALSLTTFDDGNEITVSEREVRRATAIYPSAAMMNHSCDPNIVNNFYKTRLIVRGSNDLAAGVQVFNCYGPHRARLPTSRRQDLLKAQYMFTCSCTACSDTTEFMSQFSAYICEKCKHPVPRNYQRHYCPSCGGPFNVQLYIDACNTADRLHAEGERAKSLQEQIEKRYAALQIKQKVLWQNDASLRPAVDDLARLYVEHGEYTRSLDMIKENVRSLETQFGSFSAEVGHEFRKLTDVMLERINCSPETAGYREWCLEAQKFVNKAIELMDLNFGPWEPMVKRLKKQKVVIAELIEDLPVIPDAEKNIHNQAYYNLKI